LNHRSPPSCAGTQSSFRRLRKLVCGTHHLDNDASKAGRCRAPARLVTFDMSVDLAGSTVQSASKLARCAVYTRTSSAHNLDLAFTSPGNDNRFNMTGHRYSLPMR
jgi:hypothetical protein